MSDNRQLQASTRVALAAYLHDLGKLAERAKVFSDHPHLQAHIQLYCPFNKSGGWHSHRHAAHTALAFDDIEACLPSSLEADAYPFTPRLDRSVGLEPTDSLINAAAAHHVPGTFLQWIVATADRVASGFEREEFENYNASRDVTETGKNHYQARLLTLFEQIRLGDDTKDKGTLRWRLPLKPLSPSSMFPKHAPECEPSIDAPAIAEYGEIWSYFRDALGKIPEAHRTNLSLWFDHFDALWMTAAHAIPAATAFGIRPEVSLYDHSRTTAALACALWRWHEDCRRTDGEAVQALRSRSDFDSEKLLLVQGDFFGIQEFIFSVGGQTRKQAAKLLRGRSLQVSLLSEVAALGILEELGLPPTSQVVNAAGKFMLVAPNTVEVVGTLARIRDRYDKWFEDNAFGMAGIGLAWEPASCNDFLRRNKERDSETPFSKLTARLFRSLEAARFKRFDLARRGAQVFSTDFHFGVCAWNGRLPADRQEPSESGGTIASCALSRDQIKIGESGARGLDTLLVARVGAALPEVAGMRQLELDLLGYHIAFVSRHQELTGFSQVIADGSISRIWDYSLPTPDDEAGSTPIFNGLARRAIGGYVPKVKRSDLTILDRYTVDSDEIVMELDGLKTLDMLACEDRSYTGAQWQGVVALGILKGDIDDLGQVFQAGLRQPSFAKYASLSRQLTAFYSTYLPWLLEREFPSVYTVFAGGDDFFLIGPWRTVQKVSARLHDEFARYVAGNPAIHFSVGISSVKPGAPIQTFSDAAAEALEHHAKAREGKNAVTCFGETIPWKDWPNIEKATASLEELRQTLDLSTAFIYSLLQFVQMHTNLTARTDNAMWRSRLAYRIRRLLLKKVKDEGERQRLQLEMVRTIATEGIERFGSAYRIVLFNHLYQYRSH
ncbi:MAG: type III-A CRISPR-associated protein Cas10/Csm1 [Betaproteobacteria bacterium]|nr:type III-A CRISPR-associated protein Cas10/Csm1 [Betaproteobacteria bacterium]